MKFVVDKSYTTVDNLGNVSDPPAAGLQLKHIRVDQLNFVVTPSIQICIEHTTEKNSIGCSGEPDHHLSLQYI